MAEDVRDLLVRELRCAVADRITGGIHPDEIAAGLARRLRRIKQLQEDAARSGSCAWNSTEGRAGGRKFEEARIRAARKDCRE
ncbi:hypothetical protein AB0H28_26595 [Micromonospora sp. NPDC050980]|uniref:hypothetical protein n=1 Tax=Micromonospora sp. NPDC050980 TaxID=3155161 RepID=UPI0033F09689